MYFVYFFLAVLDGLKYASSHEWVKHEGSVATVGITDHAQVSSLSYFIYKFGVHYILIFLLYYLAIYHVTKINI